jgi:hypothetical protein
LLTPPLFVLLLASLRRAFAQRADVDAPWGLLAGLAGVSVLGWFALGFFADSERVSFHWPLAGWLALTCAAPVLLPAGSRRARALVFGAAALGLLLALAFLVAASLPSARAQLAASRFYPNDFAGWTEATRWIGARVPRGEPLVASDFEFGAQLAFALDREVDVLDSALNRKHGRAAQLHDWARVLETRPASPAWFAVDDAATPLRLRLGEYHRRCAIFGALPPPQTLTVDHGRKRYFLYRYDPATGRAGCVAPALAWFDQPLPDAHLPRQFEVRGWAFKDGAGLARVEILLDGRVMANADYGRAMPDVAGYWRISTDPAHPRVGWRARVDARPLAPGAHWLGLRLHGRDGSVEDWPEQRIRLE